MFSCEHLLTQYLPCVWVEPVVKVRAVTHHVAEKMMANEQRATNEPTEVETRRDQTRRNTWATSHPRVVPIVVSNKISYQHVIQILIKL